MNHYHSGWDSFSPEPGKVESMQCRACGSTMDVKRNVDGPTSYVESIAGKKHPHDSFTCPNSQEDWHWQLIKLKQRIEDETSQYLADILQREARQILEDRRPTRKIGGF